MFAGYRKWELPASGCEERGSGRVAAPGYAIAGVYREESKSGDEAASRAEGSQHTETYGQGVAMTVSICPNRVPTSVGQ